MREILFCGKRLDNGEWVYGYYSGPVGPLVAHEIIDVDSGVSFEVDPTTVGQYIGLEDCYGVKIFEGSILREAEDAVSVAFAVKYGPCGGVQNVDYKVGYVGFYVEPVGDGMQEQASFGLRTDILYWLNTYQMAVIGNIHDN